MSKDREVRIDITADTKKATNDIKFLNKQLDYLAKTNKKVDRSMAGTTKGVNQMSRSFASLTKHVSQLAIIYGAFQGLQTTVRTFAGFEASISRLGIISGATSEELKKLEDTAKELGETTVFSASQVADGMNALAMAGLTAEESVQGIGAVLDIASIGMINLDESALIASRAMNSFGLEAGDIGRISDVMATAVTSSAQNITQLGSAYEKVGAVATNFGLSLEETTASLEILADAGRVGSEAGTQLKIALSRLAGNKEAKKYIDELGISIYDTNGNILPFIDQLRNVKDALSGLTEGQRNIKISEIFGSEAQASILILLKDLDALEAKTAELEGSFGFASSAAKALMDNLVGSYKEFSSALEGLVIKIGAELSPVLQQALDDATEFLQALSDDEIAEFGDGIADIIDGLIGLVELVVEITVSIKDFSGAIADLTGISGEMQIKLLALGYGMTKLYKVGVGLSKLYVGMKASMVAIAVAQSVLVGGVTKLTLAQKALAIVQKALNLVMSLNPIGAMIIAVSSLVIGIGYLISSNKELIETQENINNTLDETNGILTITTEQMGKLDEAGRRTFGSELRKSINDTKTAIEKADDALVELEDAFWRDEEAIEAMKKSTKDLRISLENLKQKEKDLVEVNAEAVKASNDKRKALKKEIGVAKEAIKASEALIKSREKEIKSTQKSLDARTKSHENTLIGLYKKEKKLVQDIEKLEIEKLGIHKKYNNQRLIAEASISSDIMEIEGQGLDDYRTYLLAQRNADEVYAKAKTAIKKGEIDLAKEYLKQYQDLIKINAGEEIKLKKEYKYLSAETGQYEIRQIEQIKVTRAKSIAEYKRDKEGELSLITKIYDLEKAGELEAHQQKMDNKRNELAISRIEILSQQEYLRNLANIAEVMTGIKPDLNFDTSMESIARIDMELKDIENEKREVLLNIRGNSVPAEQTLAELKLKAEEPIKAKIEVDDNTVLYEYDNTVNKLENTPIEGSLSLDASAAEEAIYDIQHLGTDVIIQYMEADTSAAEVSIEEVHNLGRQDIVALQIAKTDYATAVINTFRARAQQDMHTTLYVHTVQANQLGGLIHPIPKFATGGHLESGLGHNRKTGKLSGYGGGDRVKALLEAGEFIIKKEAVQKLGLARMYEINKGQIPKFNQGGAVTPNIPRYNTGGEVSTTSTNTSSRTVDLNLNIGNQTFKTVSDEDVATALADYLQRSTF